MCNVYTVVRYTLYKQRENTRATPSDGEASVTIRAVRRRRGVSRNKRKHRSTCSARAVTISRVRRRGLEITRASPRRRQVRRLFYNMLYYRSYCTHTHTHTPSRRPRRHSLNLYFILEFFSLPFSLSISLSVPSRNDRYDPMTLNSMRRMRAHTVGLFTRTTACDWISRKNVISVVTVKQQVRRRVGDARFDRKKKQFDPDGCEKKKINNYS